MTKLELLSRRDCEFFEIDDEKIMVVACDSCGGIGLKESDVLKAPNQLVGSLTSRVPVMELLSIGADIKTISLTIINEPFPTGSKIIEGVKAENKSLDVKFVISTEKNMKTKMTGLGITAIGMVEKEKLRICDDAYKNVFIAGYPSVGSEILENQDLILNQKMICELLEDDEILEIIPCGSSGIIGELSKLNCEHLDDFSSYEILNKSCGPASAAIVLTSNDISGRYDYVKCIKEYI
jgi:hypothetical protein